MSDVWQGPGWWLASDGKWYPAEAEPGAVFDGEIDGLEDGEADDTVAAEAETVEPEVAELPDESEAVAGEAESVEVEATPTGGWTTDDSVDAEVTASEDGWSSGFGDSSAAVVADSVVVEETVVEETEVIATFAEPVMVASADIAEPETPDFQIPDVDVPDVSDVSDVADVTGIEADVTGIEIPDASSVPDLNMPPAPEVPDVEIPEAFTMPGIDIGGEPAAPDLELPEIEVPDVELPEIEVPDVDIPDVDVPDIPDVAGIEIPDAPSAPDLEVLDIPGIPDISGIDIPGAPSVPDVDVPDVEVPDVEVPEQFSIPDRLAGTPFEAAPPLDPIKDSKLTPEPPVNNLDLRDDLLMEDDELDKKIPRAPTDPTGAIERTDSWRSPSNTDAAASSAVASAAGRPEVVDLAIPEQKSTAEVPASDRNWGLLGGAAAVIFLIAAIVWLAFQLFSGGDSADTANEEAEVATPITEETEVEEAEDGSTGDFVSVFDLRQGDCIRGDIAGQILEVERVDCAESHDFEVYIERLIDDSVITEYDEAVITEFSEGVCRSALAELVSPAENPSINFKFLQPTQDSWNSDAQDRLVTCLGFDEEGPLEGRFDDE